MVTHEQAIEHAIALIEHFLLQSADEGEPPAPETLSGISRSLDLAQAARHHTSQGVAPGISRDLCLRYKRCLEQLRERLDELKITLSDERARVLQEQSHLSRAREWHFLLGRTQ